jgi:hypothetical protein
LLRVVRLRIQPVEAAHRAIQHGHGAVGPAGDDPVFDCLEHGRQESPVLYRMAFGRFQLFLAAMQFDKEAHLGPEYRRHQRLGEEIHGTERVRLIDRHGRRVRRDENDRGGPGASLRANQPRGFEAAHARHAHVQQHGGEVTVAQLPQRFLSGGGAHQRFVQLFEQCLQCQ